MIYYGQIQKKMFKDGKVNYNMIIDNERGVSYIFGPDVIANFLKKNDMDLVCRAH